ncbi:hypothetical protein HK405_005387 [Cladochytrium tenue]|nr:hypothetical protein HK405_005387 [Cladochytrium tenue]
MSHRVPLFEKWTGPPALVCSEEFWLSDDDPVSLQAAYSDRCASGSNYFEYLQPLLELFINVFELSKPTTIYVTDPEKLYAGERTLELRLSEWLDSLPPRFWFDHLRASPRTWVERIMAGNLPAGGVWMWFVYIGSLCVLFRRQSLLYMRALSTKTDDPEGAACDFEYARKYLKYELGFSKAVEAGTSLGELVGALFHNDLLLREVPTPLTFFMVQGAMTLLISEGFISEGQESLFFELYDYSVSIATRQKLAIETYFQIFERTATGCATAQGLVRFLERIRCSDWDGVAHSVAEETTAATLIVAPNPSCMAAHTALLHRKMLLLELEVNSIVTTIKDARERARTSRPSALLLDGVRTSAPNGRGGEGIGEAGGGAGPSAEPDQAAEVAYAEGDDGEILFMDWLLAGCLQNT